MENYKLRIVIKYIKCNTIRFCVEGSKCRKAIDFAAFLFYSYVRKLKNRSTSTVTNFTNLWGGIENV